jgi:hypothetical protein
MRHLVLIALVLGGCSTICLGQNRASAAVDLCTVAANIRTYNGQQTRVTAFIGAGLEQDFLYDPKCDEGRPLVYVSLRPNITGKMAALRRILKRKRYALVTVEGIIHGPEPLKIDPKLPDWMKERFKDSTRRYGHLDSFDMMIEVVKIVQVKDVDDGIKPGHP